MLVFYFLSVGQRAAIRGVYFTSVGASSTPPSPPRPQLRLLFSLASQRALHHPSFPPQLVSELNIHSARQPRIPSTAAHLHTQNERDFASSPRLFRREQSNRDDALVAQTSSPAFRLKETGKSARRRPARFDFEKKSHGSFFSSDKLVPCKPRKRSVKDSATNEFCPTGSQRKVEMLTDVQLMVKLNSKRKMHLAPCAKVSLASLIRHFSKIATTQSFPENSPFWKVDDFRESLSSFGRN